MREYAIGSALDLAPSISSDDVRALAARGRLRRIAKGACLFNQDDRAEHGYVLIEGRVKVSLINSAGQRSVLRIHLPGSLIGLSALGSIPRRDATAVALEPVTVSELDRATLEQLLREEPALTLPIVRLLLDRLAEMHSRAGELSGNSVEQRLARALLALGQTDPIAREGRVPGIELTHEDLSNMINARRQTVTTTLSRFAQEGLIARCGRRIVILDPRGLRRLLDG